MDNERHLLQCCLCGDNHRDNLIIEDFGIAIGMTVETYSFCRNCWNHPALGQKILNFLDYPDGIKLLDDSIEIKEI